jgi:hypothetical protein
MFSHDTLSGSLMELFFFFFFFFFKGQGAPWEVKGNKGAPRCQKGAAPF